MALVLILTRAGDRTTDFVASHLEKLGVDHVRFNTEDFPVKVQMTLQLEGNLWQGKLHFPHRDVDLEEIACIWNRRPHQPNIDSAVVDSVLRDWSKIESEAALKICWDLLEDKFWLNPISAGIKLNANKWIQAIEASRIGFSTPGRSILSCNSDSIQQFCLELNSDLAIKKIEQGLLPYPDGSTGLLYTGRIPNKTLSQKDLQRIRLVPVFLQCYVAKVLELRVTVVGESVFACAIYSQEYQETMTDWRTQPFLEQRWLRHELYDLPSDIEEKCLALTKRFGLSYGAIDLALTPEGDYVFFEINQNGEWAWIEMLTGLPISKAIADLLISKVVT